MKLNRYIPQAFLLYFGLFLVGTTVFAADLPFTDVTKTDSYYDSLKGFYDNGLIQDTPDHLFHPNGQLERDEFVSIIVGVGCKQCLYPTMTDVIKYSSFPFIDVKLQNKYYYCVSYAKEIGVVQGYIIDQTGKFTCQDGTVETQTPFCPKNKIERIEAVGALMRQANLWNETLNSSSFAHNIDITDADTYWYGYAQKGIQAGILKVDANNKVYPHEFISKKEFIEMAGKIFQINQCQMTEVTTDNSISADILVFDKSNPGSCEGQGAPTSFPDTTQTTYDFYAKTETVGDFEYNWEFTNIETGEIVKESGKCLDNFDLIKTGKWLVKLTIRNKKTNKISTAITTIDITSNKDKGALSVDITADPLVTEVGTVVDFTSTINSTSNGPFSYHWDFGDGGFSSDANPTHIYTEPGVYTVTLYVRDKDGNMSVAQVVVVVTKVTDIDKDGIIDEEDVCPTVFGPLSNHGCPIINPYNGGVIGYDDLLSNKCMKDRAETIGGFYIGQATCSSCPCEMTLDYLASARACDILFPAITSPDKKTIYARGGIWQLRD